MEKAGRQQGDLFEKMETSHACRLPAFFIIPTE